MTEYAIVLEEADDGSWWAYAPDLPGVISGADTPDEARERFHEALALYREELASTGNVLPRPRSRGAVVTV